MTCEIDKVLPVCINPDKTVNDHGDKLLSLCKSRGLTILNGRRKHALDRDYTFCGDRGLKFYAWHFDITEKIIAPRFTSFADHASLHVELQFSRWNSRNPHTVDTEIHTSRKFRWNPNYYDEAKGVLLSYLENVNLTSESVDVENTINAAVEQVTLHLFKVLKQKS